MTPATSKPCATLNSSICILELPMSDEDDCPKRLRRSKRVKVHTVDSVRESVLVRFSNLTCHEIGDTKLLTFFKQLSESLALFVIAECT
jgi:hypothetical protein